MSNAALHLFNERFLPHKAYFSDDLHFDVHIAGKGRAILAKYIQFNQLNAMYWLGFDVDCIGAAIDWSDSNALAPTLTIPNPENGHSHLLYALETSIRIAPDGKMKSLRYSAAVKNALRKKLEANTANDKEIIAAYGLGRNCTLLDKTRKWAYRAIRQGWPYKLQFAMPLDENEITGIAKSIALWT